ncbi:MAG TPA: formylglycine-generating enzyme family protein [Magnetospirillaceae bacterium]|jgi:formylglycine-generating enzyme required for sulfatase activity
MRLLSLLILFAACVVAIPAWAQNHDSHGTFKDCADCPTMVAIPAGHFIMGSPTNEPGRFDTEGPRHPVNLRAFALSQSDVTDEQFLAFLRTTGYQPEPCDKRLGLTWDVPNYGRAYPPSPTEAPHLPAVCLSWYDAQAYIKWLNAQVNAAHPGEGTYRLPSEAEWEYAARGGTNTVRWWGDTIGKNNANCNGCGSKWDNDLLAPAGSFGPNPFGLYDMLGNAWQWVEDCWNDSYVHAPGDGSAWQTGDCTKRVWRGGSWDNLPSFVRSAARNRGDAHNNDFDYASYAGFRVAKSLP